MSRVLSISLTQPLMMWFFMGLCVVSLLMIVYAAWRPWRVKGVVITLVAITVGAFAAKIIVEKLWRPFPDSIPISIYFAVALTVIALFATMFIRRRILLFIALCLSLVGSAGVANLTYQLYPDLRSLVPVEVAREMSYSEFAHVSKAPTAQGREIGAKVTFSLVGEKSSFPARDAIAYIPPSYWTKQADSLPVLVLMAGSPGSPSDWFESARVDTVADEYQRTHDGKSPIVISVDATATLGGDPLCVDGPEFKVMIYLTQDVPTGIKNAFKVNSDQSQWTIGGLSYGGTCSFQVITNHPSAYGHFLDFSGQDELVSGTHEQTLAKFFGGDQKRYDDSNPAAILKKYSDGNRFGSISGVFVAGSQDAESQKGLKRLNDLAQHAGMHTQYLEVPGGHDFGTWREAMRATFALSAQYGGL
ncbi:alpha/beta hydrolase-fold protein [Corynebacterium diphtheriae bv. mitis]|uniref:alpha/beta hydrolase n=1 Tax=Corynebacterium diphtheriae TaxID=1717 RepID=UPI00217EF772|nr:alpha/beta hydrolase-fold protein [Corynebacterium diphtheriae]UWF22053.1 alpha/beta hydrolase-fold protein [Corynebacterium diphtheriae bv. mitis]UWF26459.1 alpha/beta hydrolase-fold protein [Corynebacterium diphtheriae bv. mitis]